MEHDHLCNFVKGYYEEQFFEIILNLGQWYRRCRLKDFLSGALASLLFSGAKHLCNFKGGIMGNFHVKLYEICTSTSEDVA